MIVADGSLPDEFLYPVKINFNESVRSILAITDSDEAKWQVSAAERRLSEAEALASDGRLTTEIRKMLEDEFISHVDAVGASTEQLVIAGEYSAASEIMVSLEATLIAHEEIITQLVGVTEKALTDSEGLLIESDGGELSGEIVSDLTRSLLELRELSDRVNDKKEEVAIAREAIDVEILKVAEQDNEAEALAMSRQRNAEERIAKVRDHLTAHRSNKGAFVAVEAEAELLASENALDRGRAALGDKDFTNAYRRYQEALRVALTADAYIRADEAKSEPEVSNEMDVVAENPTEERGEVDPESTLSPEELFVLPEVESIMPATGDEAEGANGGQTPDDPSGEIEQAQVSASPELDGEFRETAQ